MRQVLYAGCAFVVAACYDPPKNEQACNDVDLRCPGTQTCVNGACMMPLADAPIADACAALPSCSGDTLITCAGEQACPLGCASATANSAAHCQRMVVSNGIKTFDLAIGTGDIVLPDGEVVANTDDGSIVAMSVQLRDSGTGVRAGIGFEQRNNVGVFAFHALKTSESTLLRFSGSRAAVLLVDGQVQLNGTISVAAFEQVGGPGGGDGGAVAGAAGGACGGAFGLVGGGGAGVQQVGGTDDGGGGGGGNRSAGARGATATLGGAAGAECGSGLLALQGGGGGGAGNGITASFGRGGGGGGALQISASQSITLNQAIIDGSGAGGGGAAFSAIANGGGGGGGAGGSILLEAPALNVMTGRIYANGGGGGGAASSTNTTSGQPGVDGRRSTSAAQGGAGIGPGGNGGTSVAPVPPTDGPNNSGGGGGAGGRIIIRAKKLMGAASSSPATQSFDLLTE